MNVAAPSPLAGRTPIVSTQGAGADRDVALTRLALMVRGREVLGGSFRAALARHTAASPEALAAWADGAFTLANVNAGPGALLLLFRMTATAPALPDSLVRLAEAAAAAAEICRKAGAAAARACLDARLTLAGRPAAAAHPEAPWWRGLVRLAQEAPGAVTAAAGSSERIIGECGTAGFEAFVAAGLRAVAKTPARQAAFFRLEDPEARRVLDRLSGQVTFSTMQTRLSAFAAALWGSTCRCARSLDRRTDDRPGGSRSRPGSCSCRTF